MHHAIEQMRKNCEKFQQKKNEQVQETTIIRYKIQHVLRHNMNVSK